MKKLSVTLLDSLAERAEAAAKLVHTTPDILAQMGLNRACEEIESTGQIMSGPGKGIKRLTITVDENTASALEFLEQTRGVPAEKMARAMIEACSTAAITQGPGECVESYVDGALAYGPNCKDVFWSPQAVEALKECEDTLKRINTIREEKAGKGDA